jgi:hypothetical protein
MATKPPVGDRTQKTDPKAKEDVYVVPDPVAPDAASAPKPKSKTPPQKLAKGGSVSSASKRADGCATKGKTNCKVY